MEEQDRIEELFEEHPWLWNVWKVVGKIFVVPLLILVGVGLLAELGYKLFPWKPKAFSGLSASLGGWAAICILLIR
ncbi:MAG: hypothetical protein PHW72_03615 [Candidatus Pacebacteria bacterium]|nr:hypothetical protein [Candidatus Paceibacterota bacterium]